MASEAQIRSSLQINKGNLQYSSMPTSFVADVNGTKGPTPGAITATTSGTDVDLSQLTTPGLCRIQNLGDTYVTVGIYDPENETFFPMLELLPGETYVVRLARDIQEQYGTGVGTGTTGPDTNRLRIKAAITDCNILVEAFEA